MKGLGTEKCSRSIPVSLQWFWLALFVLTILAYGHTYLLSHFEQPNHGLSAYTLLPWPTYRNADLVCFASRFSHFRQPQFFEKYDQPFNYPPPVALIYEAIFRHSTHPVRRFVLVGIFAYLAAIVLFAWLMFRRGVKLPVASAFSGSMLLLSYPFALMFLLSNMEFAVWVVLTLGLSLYVAGYRRTGTALFGLAASLKYYPIIFLGLPLAERRYKDVLLGIACCLTSLCLSFAVVASHMHHLALAGFKTDLATFNVRYINHYNFLEGGIDHSLFELLKMPLGHMGHYDAGERLLKPYLLFMASLGLVLFLVRAKKLPLTNQILVLTIASIAFPPVSHDYTLVHLYVPWAMLVLILIRDEALPPIPGAGAALLCFALLFTPQNYLNYGAYRYGGQFKALVLLALLSIALRYPFHWKETHRQAPHAPTPWPAYEVESSGAQRI